MPRSFPEAFDFVEQHRDHLGVADPDAYVAQLRVFMDQTPEDAPTAAPIAVDAAKSLINIGVVFFAALGAFALTYRSTHGTFSFSISIVLLAVSALVTIASMIAGFAAIGLAHRRNQRPADAEGPPSAARPLLIFFRAQALMGLGALVLFAAAVLFWDAGSSTTADAAVDHLQSRIDALQARLDQQAGDLARAGQAAARQAAAGQAAASAMPPPNLVGLTQVPAKLDAIVSALRELKATIPPPRSARAPAGRCRTSTTRAGQSAGAGFGDPSADTPGSGSVARRLDKDPGRPDRAGLHRRQERRPRPAQDARGDPCLSGETARAGGRPAHASADRRPAGHALATCRCRTGRTACRGCPPRRRCR